MLAAIPGVDINAPLLGGQPPVIASIRYNRDGEVKRSDFELFKTLVEMPMVDLNVRSTKGTPLLFFVLGSMELLKLFLEQKGRYDINIRNAKGETALIHVISSDVMYDAEDVVYALLVNGIDRGLKNSEGMTAWSLTQPAYCEEPIDQEDYSWEVLPKRPIPCSDDKMYLRSRARFSSKQWDTLGSFA
jgi:hypothetical protein